MTNGTKVSGDAQPPNGHDGEKQSKGDYEVGYGKPPKHSRFKEKNTFGRGRRSGSKNLKTIVNETLQAKVSVTIGGKVRKLTKIELAVYQAANKAGSGDMKAIEKVLQLMERYGSLDGQDAPPPEKLKRDFTSLRHFLSQQEFIDPDYEEQDDE